MWQGSQDSHQVYCFNNKDNNASTGGKTLGTNTNRNKRIRKPKKGKEEGVCGKIVMTTFTKGIRIFIKDLSSQGDDNRNIKYNTLALLSIIKQ